MENTVIALVVLIIQVLIVVLPLLFCMAYLTLAERRVIGWIQERIGPNRVGPLGLFQPIADMFKLMFKEIIYPASANRYLFITAPILSIGPAIAAWAVIPFAEGWVISDLNVGLLYIFTMSSVGIYGIIIAGWASNSRYAFLGALRSAAQVVSYEIPMGFALIGVVMAAESLDVSAIVLAQQGGFWHWYFIPLFPLFVVYWISAVAETNRLPFDMAEGESEIVAGFHVEYSGMAFALFFLAEYINMILVSAIASLLFLGGWLSPFQGIPVLGEIFYYVPGLFWFVLKICFFLFLFLWYRGTFPRYRYDQIMRLGWKVFIPVTIVWIIVLGFLIYFEVPPWFQR